MKNIYILAFLMFAFLIFWACSENLFGSSGTQSRCDNKNLDCLQFEAEELFRAGKYSESYKNYEKIVNKDSNSYADPKRSVGYFGMAKAGLWMDSVTIFNFLGLSKNNKDLGGDPAKIAKFFQQELEVERQNKYLQGSKKADNALRELSRRDSLTEMYFNSIDGKKDSLTNLFEETYCSRKPCRDTLNKDEVFPLSDMKYRKTFFSTGYAVSALMRTILGSVLFDPFGNGCIFNFSDKPSDPIGYGCNSSTLIPSNNIDLDMSSIVTFDEDGMIQVAFDELYDELLKDAALVDALNERFDNLTDDIGGLIDLVGSITGGATYGDDDTVIQDSLQKQLNEFKDYALFVRLDDRIDNDGDGCIDEELAVSGKAYDVDGDGFYSEDLRIILVPPPDYWNYVPPPDVPQPDDDDWKCENNRCFKPSSGKEDEYFIMKIRQNSEYTFVKADTIVRVAWSLVPGFWTEEFLSLEDDMARNGFKKEIQVERDKDGKTKCWSLADRQDRLGGCWKDYSAQDFINYRNNPLQIEKGGMNPECKGII